MKINATPALRALQATLSITILSLMIYVSSWWTTHWRQPAPPEIHFLLFAPAWSLASLLPLLLLPLRFSSLLARPAIRYAGLALEALTMLFWFVGFVALAVFLGERICFGMVCDVARAGAGLGGVSWGVWAGSLGVGVWGVVGERRAGGGDGGKKAQVMEGV